MTNLLPQLWITRWTCWTRRNSTNSSQWESLRGRNRFLPSGKWETDSFMELYEWWSIQKRVLGK